MSKKRENSMEKLNPQVRLKQLIDYSNQVVVDPHVPPMRYYRSGIEMERMANVYYREGSLENAYVLYLKFMTLFLEKIRKHPEFNLVPVEIKAKNQAKLREILPEAEKLKGKLLKQYADDYQHYLAELKHEEQLKKKKEKEKLKRRILSPSQPQVFATDVSDVLSNISYPDADHGLVVTLSEPEDLVPTAPPSTPKMAASFIPVPESSTVGLPSIPTVDRSTKPDTSPRSSYDSNVLRTVVVPVKVMTLFQVMAQSNTFKNVETCGVLTGKLEQNELIITHMILPKQKGTSDSCSTMNEEEIFDYQDQHNLITLGWIHTHPTQTAFLSSVDLHTHCPYQLLMPEAIAIVCSPKYNETGFYHLTPYHGLQFIANCRKTGFHPHPTQPPLFVDAEHVRIESTAPLEVLDLRKA